MKRELWNNCAGYVSIRITGVRLERILDELLKNCCVRDVKRSSYATVMFKVPFTCLSRTRKIADSYGVQCEMLKKDAKASAISAVIKKWWVLVAAATVLSGTMLLSGYCLKIDIEGAKSLSEFELSHVLAENGARVLSKKSKIDFRKLERALCSSFPEIVHADMKFEGSRLIVTIGEGQLPPDILPDEPCSIVAGKGGTVYSVTVASGERCVSKGCVVKRGDILISGQYIKKEIAFNIAASGNVIALVDYVGRGEQHYEDKMPVRTGAASSERYMLLGGFRIKLSGENPFAVYETETNNSDGLGNFPGLFSTETVTYYECELQENNLQKSKAKLAATEKAYYDALQGIPEKAVIVDFNSYASAYDSRMTVLCVITVKEDIGILAAASEIIESDEDGQNIGRDTENG